MNKEDVKKLANLSRLEISDSELESFTVQIDSILHYVEQLKEVTAKTDNGESRIENAGVRNILRQDKDPHEPNHTADLLASAPETQDGFIKVKKIL